MEHKVFQGIKFSPLDQILPENMYFLNATNTDTSAANATAICDAGDVATFRGTFRRQTTPNTGFDRIRIIPGDLLHLNPFDRWTGFASGVDLSGVTVIVDVLCFDNPPVHILKPYLFFIFFN